VFPARGFRFERRSELHPLYAGVSARQEFVGPVLGRFVISAVDVLSAPVIADGLSDRQNVGFGERASRRRASIAAGVEADQLVGITEIRPAPEASRSSQAKSTSIPFGANRPASGEMIMRAIPF
jgi:hypothetical protein